MHNIRISVRNLVEFILREGDIDNRRSAGSKEEAMQEGSRMHRKIQKGMGASYRAEVSLKLPIDMGEYTLQIEGRADGIIETEHETVIDEIKGVYKNIYEMKEPIGVHLAQAKCYAYIYATQQNLSKIGVQMTYCNLETELIRRFKEEIAYEDLKVWFWDIIERYKKWADWEMKHRKERTASIEPLEFPYAYRQGQRDMTASVYSSIKRGENLFVQAPTGIGKTMATIFPSVKAMGQGMGDKLFYLTAKTSLAEVAQSTFETLRKDGMKFQTITITAKEKCCANEIMECNPDVCPYAKGHYDRVNDAIFDLICHEDRIDQTVIMEYAGKHQVCPFEFELDVSLFVDGIICDYNYAFDPRVNLKRYFAEGIKGDYLFLVDEAHNLVDRAGAMYSAALIKEDFLHVKRILEEDFKRRFTDENERKKQHGSEEKVKLLEKNLRKLIGALERCNKELLTLKRECETYQVLEDIVPFYLKALLLVSAYENYLEEEKEIPDKDAVMTLYFELLHFMNMYDLLTEKTVIYTELLANGHFMLKLYCVDPSTHLKGCLDKARATVFFSATMLPIHYYKELLSNQEQDRAIYIPSPFDEANRRILVGKDVSSKYTRRGTEEYRKICEYIEAVYQEKQGNYMVFFPSYQMLGDVYEVAEMEGLTSKMHIVCQSGNMKEEERQAFLDGFQSDSSVVAFCILGGIFSEGIDLTMDRLIGVLVVGTGLPMVCHEREILKNYFDEHKGNGFDYAYRYPGMNKVEQAAGRVIRTEEDKGLIFLLDDRFIRPENVALYPMEWKDYQVIDRHRVADCVRDFWKGNM